MEKQLNIEMKPVNSLSITAVGYDADTATCVIEFASGGRYYYHSVSPEAHKALVEAESIGKHFHAQFKPSYTGLKQANPMLFRGQPMEMAG